MFNTKKKQIEYLTNKIKEAKDKEREESITKMGEDVKANPYVIMHEYVDGGEGYVVYSREVNTTMFYGTVGIAHTLVGTFTILSNAKDMVKHLIKEDIQSDTFIGK